MTILEEGIPSSARANSEGTASLIRTRSTHKILIAVGTIGLLLVIYLGTQRFSALDISQMFGGSATSQTTQSQWLSPAEADIVEANPAAEGSASPDALTVSSVADTGNTGATSDSENMNDDAEAAESVRANADSMSQANTKSGVSVSAVAGVNGVVLRTRFAIDQLDLSEGELVASLPEGTRLTLTGRSPDGNWLYGTSGNDTGWVDATTVIAFGLDKLPVMSIQDTSVDGENGSLEMDQIDADMYLASYYPDATTSDSLDVQSTALPVVESDATVVLDEGRLNIRSGPGIDYEIIGKAYPDEVYTAVGRDEQGDWIQIALSDDGFGWAAAEYVSLEGPTSELPVSSSVIPTSIWQDEMNVDIQSSILPGDLDNAASGSGVEPNVSAIDDNQLVGTLVFEDSNGGTIYAYDFETGALIALTHGFDPAVSPDGDTVAFTRDGGDNGLYLIDIDGSNERLIWSGRSGLGSPSWSPDGEWIVFSFRGDYEECWQMGPMCLSENPGFGDAELVRTYNYQLGVVDVNGQNYHEPPALNSSLAADWNDAGIVYQSDSGIQLTSDEPNGLNQLVSFDYLKPTYQDPALQPDGSLVVFQSREGSHYEIFTMNADGSNIQSLTRPATTLVDEIPSNVSPAWSPDGQSIVFLSNRTEDGNAGDWRIWVMDANGDNQRPLDIDVPIQYSFGAEQMVSWGE